MHITKPAARGVVRPAPAPFGKRRSVGGHARALAGKLLVGRGHRGVLALLPGEHRLEIADVRTVADRLHAGFETLAEHLSASGRVEIEVAVADGDPGVLGRGGGGSNR